MKEEFNESKNSLLDLEEAILVHDMLLARPSMEQEESFVFISFWIKTVRLSSVAFAESSLTDENELVG